MPALHFTPVGPSRLLSYRYGDPYRPPPLAAGEGVPGRPAEGAIGKSQQDLTKSLPESRAGKFFTSRSGPAVREFDRWYRQAVRNLEAARSDLASGFYEWACFKAQQAAELAVKALLRARGVPRGGHSVLKLLEIAEAELGLQVPQELKEAAAELDNMYIPPRYPDAFAEGSPYEFFTKAMAERAMANAERILRWAAEAWSAGR